MFLTSDSTAEAMELVVLTFFSVELLLSFYKQINMNEKKNTCVRKRINKIIIKKIILNISYLLLTILGMPQQYILPVECFLTGFTIKTKIVRMFNLNMSF